MTLSEVERLKLAREAAEARIADLERERDEFRDSQRFWHERSSLLAQDVARADRLAEVIARRLRNSPYPDEEVADALASYRSASAEAKQT